MLEEQHNGATKDSISCFSLLFWTGFVFSPRPEYHFFRAQMCISSYCSPSFVLVVVYSYRFF
jgi:hypothetical protein